jgi:hypothetical protein
VAAVRRAHELVPGVAVVGETGGVPLAGRLAALLARQPGTKLGDSGVDLPVGVAMELLPLGVDFGATARAAVAGRRRAGYADAGRQGAGQARPAAREARRIIRPMALGEMQEVVPDLSRLAASATGNNRE